MVDVSDAGHGDKGQVVQEPADDGVDAGVVDLVNFEGAQVDVAALEADEVEGEEEGEEDEGKGGGPVDEGVA